MRIYTDYLEMAKEVERDLFEMGIHVQSGTVQDKNVEGDENFKTVELNGYSYKLVGYNNMKKMLNHFDLPLAWVEKEFIERISPELINPGEAYKEREKYWEPFLHNEEFEYTYNERIRDQIPYVISELYKFPNTRQAVITIYDQHKDMRNFGGKARVPCSMYYQFFLRNNQLHMMYTMRSCDFLKHFPTDVLLAVKLNECIARKLEVEVGTFTHFIGSLHAFYVDMKSRGIF